MKGYLKYIVLAVASLLTFSSCEEKDVEVYGNDAGARAIEYAAGFVSVLFSCKG